MPSEDIEHLLPNAWEITLQQLGDTIDMSNEPSIRSVPPSLPSDQTLIMPSGGSTTDGVTQTLPHVYSGSGSKPSEPSSLETVDTAQWSLDDRSRTRAGLKSERLLGTGGMGAVYQAQQQRLNRPVAVKVLHANDAERSSGFVREMRLTARLEHPGVPPVHDGGDDFLVMRMIEGRTMQEVWDDPSTELADAVRMLRAVTETLGFAHEKGIIHRDLKPANIMIGKFGEVQVLDWGLAIELQQTESGWSAEHISERLACAGTPNYIAPEAANGARHNIGFATDVYGCGAMLYRLLTGHSPHHGKRIRDFLICSKEGSWKPVLEENSSASPELIRWQEAAMATDPAERCSMQAFRQGLDTWLHRIDAEDKARGIFQKSRELLRELQGITDHAERYTCFQQVTNALDQVVGVMAHWQLAKDARQDAYAQWVTEAIDHGDLGLAQDLVEEVADQHIHNRVQQAIGLRQSQERKKWLTRVVLGAMIGLIILTAFIGVYIARHSQVREQRQRMALAAELIAGDAENDREAMWRLYRAAGLAPQSQGLLPRLNEIFERKFALFIAESEWQAATDLIAEVEQVRVFSDETIDAFRQRLSAERNADAIERDHEIKRRRKRLQQIVDVAEIGAPMNEWFATARQEILQWDGHELNDEIVHLLEHTSPLVQLLMVDVLEEKPELVDAKELFAKLHESDDAVAKRIWSVLAEQRDERVLEDMITWLDRLPQDIERWSLASQIKPWALAQLHPDDWDRRKVFGDYARWETRSDLSSLSLEDWSAWLGWMIWGDHQRGQVMHWLKQADEQFPEAVQLRSRQLEYAAITGDWTRILELAPLHQDIPLAQELWRALAAHELQIPQAEDLIESLPDPLSRGIDQVSRAFIAGMRQQNDRSRVGSYQAVKSGVLDFAEGKELNAQDIAMMGLPWLPGDPYLLWRQIRAMDVKASLPFAELAWKIDPYETIYEAPYLRHLFAHDEDLFETRAQFILNELQTPFFGAYIQLYDAYYEQHRWDDAYKAAYKLLLRIRGQWTTGWESNYFDGSYCRMAMCEMWKGNYEAAWKMLAKTHGSVESIMVRLVWDQLLVNIPEMRNQGWPGVDTDNMVALLLAQSIWHHDTQAWERAQEIISSSKNKIISQLKRAAMPSDSEQWKKIIAPIIDDISSDMAWRSVILGVYQNENDHVMPLFQPPPLKDWQPNKAVQAEMAQWWQERRHLLRPLRFEALTSWLSSEELNQELFK